MLEVPVAKPVLQGSFHTFSGRHLPPINAAISLNLGKRQAIQEKILVNSTIQSPTPQSRTPCRSLSIADNKDLSSPRLQYYLNEVKPPAPRMQTHSQTPTQTGTRRLKPLQSPLRHRLSTVERCTCWSLSNKRYSIREGCDSPLCVNSPNNRMQQLKIPKKLTTLPSKTQLNSTDLPARKDPGRVLLEFRSRLAKRQGELRRRVRAPLDTP